jgi:hypothetical protein
MARSRFDRQRGNLRDGLWYLFFSLLISFVLLQLSALLFEEPRKSTFFPPNTRINNSNEQVEQKPGVEKWLWHLLLSIPVGIVLVLVWSYIFTDGLLNNMPCVEMVRTITAEEEQGHPASASMEESLKAVCEKVAPSAGPRFLRL